MTVAIIIAGVMGVRLGADIPKQFVQVNGKPVLLYTLEAFERHPMMDAIELVCIDGWQDAVWAYAKEYGKSKGMDVKCYVPTHSLINYSQWQIVSPEASLASLSCVDGYIAQVWTGTSRVLNYYDGM